MAAKRYYGSKKGGSSVNHASDRFNDEEKHDRESYRMAPEYGRGANYFPTMSGQGRGALEKPEMIKEDHRAIANLPQEVMIKPYPMTGPYMPEDLDDTQRGVNEQMDYDDNHRRKHFYPKKV